MDAEKREKSTTLSGRDPEAGMETATGAPAGIDPKTGMHKDYWVLTKEERAKGFVRPVRQTYIHKGIRPKHPVYDLTEEQKKRHANMNYVKFEPYPENPSIPGAVGRYWTEEQLNSGCGTSTTMALALAETYARDPMYYGSTFCAWCEVHKRVDEFVWDGTDEMVGS